MADCKHDQNIRIETVSKFPTDHVIENGGLVLVSDGDPYGSISFYWKCGDCGESGSGRKLPNWLAEIIYKTPDRQPGVAS